MSPSDRRAAAAAAAHPGAIIRPWRGHWPTIAADAFIAPGAVVIGRVEIGVSSVWFGAVLRGDDHTIRVGARTNIQDGAVVHVTLDQYPTVIGDDVTIGHGARLHGCRLENGCLVGIGAIVLDGAVVGQGAMIAAGALVTPRKRVPGGEVWAGSPARLLRVTTEADRDYLVFDAAHYVRVATEYRAALASALDETAGAEDGR